VIDDLIGYIAVADFPVNTSLFRNTLYWWQPIQRTSIRVTSLSEMKLLNFRCLVLAFNLTVMLFRRKLAYIYWRVCHTCSCSCRAKSVTNWSYSL